MRERAVSFLRRSGLMPHVRRAQRLVGSRTTRRDLRDHDHLRVLLAAVLRPDSNCIDVGANVGGVLEEIVRLAPDGRHIAYEPIPALSADLARRFPGVEVREAALSNARGEASFEHVLSQPGMSGLRERSAGRDTQVITVRTEDLDSSLPDGYSPALIKIDVEGAEGLVLEGAIETLAAHRPVVVFEHGAGGAPQFGTRPSDVYALLTERPRLRIFDLDGNGPLSGAEFDRVFEAGSHWNFFAAPR